MKRKIVKHGSATLTISLPSKWVKKYGIKPGDSLDLEESEGSMLIKCPNYRESLKEAFIDLSKYDEVAGRRYLSALFKGGCDTIRIRYEKTTTFSTIVLPMLGEFIGFEVMKQDSNGCLVKEISGLTENTELEGLIRRLMLVLRSLSKDCSEAVSSMEPQLLQGIVERDVTVNRVANFIRRLLNKRGTARIRDLPLIYYIVESLESLGDEYKYLCMHLLEDKNRKLDKETQALLADTTRMLETFTSLYFKFSLVSASHVAKGCHDLNEQLKQIKTNNKGDIVPVMHICRMAKNLHSMVSPLFTLRLPDMCLQDVPGNVRLS